MISEDFSNFVINLREKDIPVKVKEMAKDHVLDSLGLMVAVSEFEQVKPLINVIASLGGTEESSIVGHKIKVPSPNAVLANSTMAHLIDFDDTHLTSGVHVSSTAVPSGLAAGEKMDAGGKEFLVSVIAGYEVGARIGAAAPWKFHERGFHPTSVVGVFIATTVAGRLLGLKEEELVDAYGIAGSFASGILQSINEGVQVKPFHPAWASHAGIIASLMAKHGYKGPKGVFEGRQGIFNTFLYGEKVDLRNITYDLGKNWETLNISVKPYPACHATHSSIDAMILLRSKYNLDPEDIEEIDVEIPKIAYDLGLCLPEKYKPVTTYDAKFSIPYVSVAALVNGKVTVWDFEEQKIRDNKVLRMMEKIKAYHNPELDKYVNSNVAPARVRVRVKGKVYEEGVVNHKGTPGNPVNREDVINKFKDNTRFSWAKGNSDKVIERVIRLEDFTVKDIISLLVKG